MPAVTLTDSDFIEYDASNPLPVTPVGGGTGGAVEVEIANGADVALGSTTDDAYTGTEPYTAMAALRAIANAAISALASPVNLTQTNGNALVNDNDALSTVAPVPVGGKVSPASLGTWAIGDAAVMQFSQRGFAITSGSGIANTPTDALSNTSIAVSAASTPNTNGAEPAAMHHLVLNKLYDSVGNAWPRQRATPTGVAYMEAGPYLRGRVTADGQVKGSAGFIHTVSIAPLTATPTAGLLTIYDSTTETGTVVYAEWIFATTTGHTITLDIPCATGIYVGFDGTLANVQVTVAYR